MAVKNRKIKFFTHHPKIKKSKDRLRPLTADELERILWEEDIAGVNTTLQEMALEENRGKRPYLNKNYEVVFK